jgi:branched-chain amino acid transport system permease protein
MIIQILLNGIVSGLSIALLGTAFSVVYLPTRVFHIALGGVFAIAPYFASTGASLSGSMISGLAISTILGIGLSIFCEMANHGPLFRKQVPDSMHIISSLGIYIILIQLISIFWGSHQGVIGDNSSAIITSFPELKITYSQLLALLTAAASLVAYHLWIRLTGVGLHLRALADSPITFTMFAGNVNAHRILAFGISGFLAVVASLADAYQFGYRPTGALKALLLAVAAMIVGGRNHIAGPFVGGLLLGILREGVAWYLSPKWQDPVVFALLVLLLFFRPKGLLGRITRLEAA